MSDDIVISGGGSTAVATGELSLQSHQLHRAATRLSDVAQRLARIDRVVTAGAIRSADAPVSAMDAERDIDDAAAIITKAVPQARLLAAALDLSAEAYGEVEGSVQQLGQQLAARFGWAFGAVLPAIALYLLPTALGLGASLALGWALVPRPERDRIGAALPGWIRRNSAGLTDEKTVQFVRLTVMSADDFGAGLFHLPPALDHLFGDEGLGITGVATSATAVIGAGAVGGALLETGVTVTKSGRSTTSNPPGGLEGRTERIPQGPAQVRIERYTQATGPDRYEVYIGGTRDFSLTSTAEPWDMTSNIREEAGEVVGENAGSYRAVQQAMADAGIDKSSPVVFNGHSQGGLVAARLAASGEYDAKGLFTFGAPAAQVAVPANVPWVALEHTDDLVPALGGSWSSHDAVIVRREAFDGVPVPTDVALPAHQRDVYSETARLADHSVEPRLAGAVAKLGAFDSGATAVTSTVYIARREG